VKSLFSLPRETVMTETFRWTGSPTTDTTSLFNPLKTKHRLIYLKTQSVPRCKHFSSRL
jgi:hypothetical protein